MEEVIFSLNGVQTTIKCNKEDLMKDIIQKFSKEISSDLSNILFLYKGNKINPNTRYIDQISESDKNKNSLSIICLELKNRRESLKLDKQKSNKNRRSIKTKKDNININKDKLVVPTMNEIRKSIRRRVEINDPAPKVEISLDNNSNNIFNDYFRNYTCEIIIPEANEPKWQNTNTNINTNNNEYNPINLIENKERNLTQSTNIIIDNTLPIKPKEVNIELIEKEMNEFETKFESINNKIKEIINSLNQISENINEFYEVTNDKMNNLEMVQKDEQIINEIKYIISYYDKFIYDINSSLENNKISNISENFNKIMSKYKDSHKDLIKYKINEGDKKIRIFSANFVLNNWDNCKIICDDKEYELTEYFDLENYKKNEKFLEIKLKNHRDMKDISFMFSDCKQLVSISKLLSWNTDNIISMKGMFAGCSSLISLPDLSLLKTNKVKNFRGIFAGCESLVSLPNISKWNTDNVTDMQYMFNNCYSLKTLPDISKWNTSNVIDMRFMFCNCRSLIALPDLSRWNTKKVTNMQSIFEGCSSLFSLPNIGRWDLGKKVDIRNMFNKCKRTLRIPLKFKKALTTYNNL